MILTETKKLKYVHPQREPFFFFFQFYVNLVVDNSSLISIFHNFGENVQNSGEKAFDIIFLYNLER